MPWRALKRGKGGIACWVPYIINGMPCFDVDDRVHVRSLDDVRARSSRTIERDSCRSCWIKFFAAVAV